MFVTNWISPTKIQKISEITNFFRHYFLSRTEVNLNTSASVRRASNVFVASSGSGSDSNIAGGNTTTGDNSQTGGSSSSEGNTDSGDGLE